MRIGNISSITTILLLYYSSIFFKGFANSFLDELNCYYFLIGLYLCLFVYLSVSLFLPVYTIALKKIDIFLLGLFTLFEISVMTNGKVHYAEDGIVLIHALFFLYIILRIVICSDVVLKALCLIILSGFIFELIAGICDLVAVGMDKITNLDIRGTFYNSGIYIAYVLSLLPVVLPTLINLTPKWMSWLFLGTLITLILSFSIVNESRASVIAITLVLAGTYLSSKFNFKGIFLKGILFTSFLMLISVAMLFKQTSSMGRWLIWQVTLNNFWHRPLLGYGPTMFSKLYPDWQAFFFMHNGSQSLIYQQLADVTHVAFNEYLQILAETGLIGFILFVLLIWFIISLKAKPGKTRLMLGFKSMIFFYLIFAGFSYPFHILPTLFVFVCGLAAIVNMSAEDTIGLYIGRLPLRLGEIAGIIVSGYLIVWLYLYGSAVTKWKSIDKIAVNDERAYGKDYEQLYPALQLCFPYLISYGQNLLINGNINKAITVITKANEIYPTENGYLLLGEAYEAKKDYRQSITCYSDLASMLPAHFRPKYRLVKVYLLKSDSIKARTLAKEIIKMPIKVPSDEIFQIKLEMKALVYQNN